MKKINRRAFMFIILLIVIVGTAGILSLLYFYSTNETLKKPVRRDRQAEYISSISSYNKSALRLPMSVAVNKGNLYILDSGNKRVAVLSPERKPVNRIALTPAIGINMPVGIALDEQERIFISAVGKSSAIVVYNKAGKFLYRFPQGIRGKSSEATAASRPVGVFVTDKKLFVTDVLDQKIRVFDLSGKLLLEFGRPGNDKGEFLYPNGVTVTDKGLIYVSDSNNGRVQVFNNKGSFLYMFSGPDKDKLALPRGLAFDTKGQLHVVDTLKHKVFVFTGSGKYIYAYGSFGSRGANLSYPNAISIDSVTGNVFIADKQNSRVSEWKP